MRKHYRAVSEFGIIPLKVQGIDHIPRLAQVIYCLVGVRTCHCPTGDGIPKGAVIDERKCVAATST
jgi:hypothetical protein